MQAEKEKLLLSDIVNGKIDIECGNQRCPLTEGLEISYVFEQSNDRVAQLEIRKIAEKYLEPKYPILTRQTTAVAGS